MSDKDRSLELQYTHLHIESPPTCKKNISVTYNLSPTSNLTTQARKTQKTSKSTTHKHPTSNLTTRQALISNPLCTGSICHSGPVPAKQKIIIFLPPELYTKTSKILYLEGFSLTHFSTLDINTTVSTCVVQGNISTGWTSFRLYPFSVR